MRIKRIIFNDLQEQFSDHKVSILVGPRQVGKTYLLKELQQSLEAKGHKTRYFDLEQPNDLLALGKSEQEQFNVLTQSGRVVFVDEFHLLKNISKLFKAIHDSPHKVKIYASGSSALEMHKHLKESMAGRVLFNRIFPLTLAELKQDKKYKVDSVLNYGGLPGLLHCKDKNDMMIELQNMVATYIQKDIKSLIKEENIRAFNLLIALLSEYQGSVVVSASLSKEIGLSKPTIEKYLEILSKTYVCHCLPSFAKNLSNELKKSKKYYLYDLGIRNSIVKDFRNIQERPDAGVLKESFVLLSIIKQIQPNMDVRFWRTKHGQEIDFVILKNKIPFPIEVKSKMLKPEIPKAVKIFLDNYTNAPGAIIYNDDLRETVEYKNKPVIFQSWTSAEDILFMKQ